MRAPSRMVAAFFVCIVLVITAAFAAIDKADAAVPWSHLWSYTGFRVNTAPAGSMASYFVAARNNYSNNTDLNAVNSVFPLYEALWRGGQGWTRNVPLDAGGNMQWGSAPAWSGPLYASGLPGSGSLQTFVNYRIADRLVQGYWRNNEGWLREVPIVNDVVQWGGAPAFSGPIPFDFPGSGALQAHGDYGVGNTLIQAVWRGNQGWTRNVPISNGIIQWGQRGPWGGPLSIGGLPGSGDMQAQDNFVINTTYWQVTWRSNVQYTRSAPIVNGAVQFGQASAWSATTANENLPGSGNIETQANYSLDWVSYANEAPPRGEIRVEESDLGEYNIFQAYAQPYTVDATGEAKACYLYGIPIPTGQCTSRKATSARIYFNTHYVTSNKSYLARHELGHIFGLYHQPCDEPASVMYEPSCGPEYTTLQADEIVWINNNY